MLLCTLESCLKLLAFTVEYDELVTNRTDHDRRICIGFLDRREWEPADLLIEFCTVSCECTCIPGTTEQHTRCLLIHQLFSLAVILTQRVHAIREIPCFYPLLNLLAGLDEAVVRELAFACYCLLERLKSAVTCSKVHIIHRTGPLGTVRQCERRDIILLQGIADVLQVCQSLRFFQLILIEHFFIIEDT